MHTEGKGVRGMKRILVFEFSKNMFIKMQQTQKRSTLKNLPKKHWPPTPQGFWIEPEKYGEEKTKFDLNVEFDLLKA